MSSSDASGRLEVRCRGAWIQIFGADTQLVEQGHDAVERDVPSGVYSVYAQIGPREISKLLVVRPRSTVTETLVVAAETAAPVTWWSESESEPARLASELTQWSAGADSRIRDAALVVIVHDHRTNGPETGQDDVPDEPDIHHGSTHGSDKSDRGPARLMSVIGQDAEDDPTGDVLAVAPPPAQMRIENRPGVSGCALRLPPGGYRLGWSQSGWEQSAWLAEGMQTIVFVVRKAGSIVHQLTSVHYRPINESWRSDEQARDVEVALAWLRSTPQHDRPLRTFLAASSEPTVVLYSLYGLARSAATSGGLSPLPELDAEWLKALEKLAGALPGHPDVLALQTWLRPDALRGSPGAADSVGMPPVGEASSWPPMLDAAMNLLIAEQLLNLTKIPPESEADLVSGSRVAAGPWMLWQDYEASDDVEIQVRRPLPRLIRPEGKRRLRGGGIQTAPPRPAGSDMLRKRPGSSPVKDSEVPLHVKRVKVLAEQIASYTGADVRGVVATLGVSETARRLGMAPSRVENAVRALGYRSEA